MRTNVLFDYILQLFFCQAEFGRRKYFVCRFVNDVLHIWNGKIVVLSLPNSRLFGKVIEGIEGVAGMGFLIIFPVAALCLGVKGLIFLCRIPG